MTFLSRLLLCLLLVLSLAALGAGDTQSWKMLEMELRQTLVGNVATLRHCYEGQKLRYDPDGKIRNGVEGLYEFDGAVQIQNVTLKKNELKIVGKRPNAKADKDNKVYFQDSGVEVSIRATLSPDQDPDSIRKRVNAIFYTSPEVEGVVKPAYLHSLREPVSAERLRRFVGESQSDEPVIRITSEVTPPTVIHKPAPEYTQEGRKLRRQGRCIISALVGSDGRVKRMQVLRRLGARLDESAMRTVKEWRFEPARKDGKPVAVLIQIEVGFNLY
jgi:TonB family protein